MSTAFHRPTSSDDVGPLPRRPSAFLFISKCTFLLCASVWRGDMAYIPSRFRHMHPFGTRARVLHGRHYVPSEDDDRRPHSPYSRLVGFYDLWWWISTILRRSGLGGLEDPRWNQDQNLIDRTMARREDRRTRSWNTAHDWRSIPTPLSLNSLVLRH